ncbi:hypothetical protein [Marinobacter sp. JSM 1782161]|uniref:hypothetical protein n=1 Tax=Marinobacter sp. JSM 1782161 TaxID=2685906 RepID=UPI0014022C25|nr:hypothetical protein [Marinobacter sp. JSM 1782161]
MEPIRPERDEVRAGKPQKQERKEKKTPSSNSTPEIAVTRANGKGGMAPLLLILLILAIAAGGWGWYSQKQQIDQLSERLQEADYWARQSKLALARFEGQLSETGENLEQKDSTLDDLRKEVKTANSEIRKLWAVANERNKEAINANKAALAYLEETTSNLKNDLGEQVKSMQGNVDELASTAEARAETVAGLQSRLDDLQPRLTEVEKTAEGMSDTVTRRLERFGREQDLARQELVARVDSLENGSGNMDSLENQLSATQQRLSEIENAIDAIDAARAQLNSRLIRLDEAVTSLRRQGG